MQFFQWMQTQTDMLAKYNASMAMLIETERVNVGKTFIDTYPFAEELADATPDETLVVDVGGGYGQLLRELRTRIPQVTGKMVLQDLPETVKGAAQMDNVVFQPYNFLQQEQPVKGEDSFCLSLTLPPI
jgi:demethylsterigmatocystin 6-O-methyltransferase